MNMIRFSEEQIVAVLKEAEAGVSVKELCQRIGISDATFHHWKAKYEGLEVNEARRLRQLEDENGLPRKIVAHQALDTDALKLVLSKKWQARRTSERRCVSLPHPSCLLAFLLLLAHRSAKSSNRPSSVNGIVSLRCGQQVRLKCSNW
jgi:putative transposase